MQCDLSVCSASCVCLISSSSLQENLSVHASEKNNLMTNNLITIIDSVTYLVFIFPHRLPDQPEAMPDFRSFVNTLKAPSFYGTTVPTIISLKRESSSQVPSTGHFQCPTAPLRHFRTAQLSESGSRSLPRRPGSRSP